MKYTEPQITISMREYTDTKVELDRLKKIAEPDHILRVVVKPNPKPSFPAEQAFIIETDIRNNTTVMNRVIGYLQKDTGLKFIEETDMLIIKSNNGKRYVQ